MKKRLQKTNIKRIIIRATNWVGDGVMTIPTVESIRSNFPRSHIALLARPWVIPLFQDHPAVDEIIPFAGKRNPLGRALEILRLSQVLRRKRFDLAILLQNAFEAALIAFLGGARFRVGYNTDARGILLTHGVDRRIEILSVHQVEYYLSLVRGVGLEAESRPPVIHVSESMKDWARAYLNSLSVKQGDFILGLGPGAIYGEAKRWPADRFASIGDRAHEKWGAKVLVFGSKKEEDICKTTSAASRNRFINLCGATSLDQAIALVSQCSMFVTNDSGLMHVAAALNIPTVAIFGSTNPETTGPYSPFARIVKHQIPCAPCLKKKCPSDFRCMLSITPEEVWSEMERLKVLAVQPT